MAIIFPPKPGASHCAPAGPTAQETWSRRRWAAIVIASFALGAALLANVISARSVLMLGGSLLTFALSADRLDQVED